ncbi:response regulator transcription factor [Burkholderia pyrrocinia]|uniref:response regulator transcription factor n=1 Tax=Burkholderia pyrrocinia TaxID=60550 RepID=UPI00158A686A|nr:response regulator transcription factor [Burkholderia pyrrocinia]
MRHFSSMKIAILEPNRGELDRLQQFFSERGHIALGATSDGNWLSLLDTIEPDIALVDWTQPDEQRMSTLLLTRECSQVPIVLCVNPGTPDDLIASGLNAGADLNITVPIGSAESLARIDALVRRAHLTHTTVRGSSIFGDYRFTPGDLSVERKGYRIRLSAKEFEIAMLLFRHLSNPVSRQRLALVMWGDGKRSASRGIDTYVSAVRMKLGLHPENGYRLRAVYGCGYQLEQVPSRSLPSGDAERASS